MTRTQARVGSVVLLGELPPDRTPVHGVVAARAPWSVRELIVVPADSLPLAGAHDLYLERTSAAVAGEHLWGLWLRGLTMVAMTEAELADRPIEGVIAEDMLKPLGDYVRGVDLLRRPQDQGVDEWTFRVAELVDPGALSPQLRRRIRQSPRSVPLIAAVSEESSLAAHAPRQPSRLSELRAEDGRVIRIVQDPAIGRMLVLSEPADDVLQVTVGGREAVATALGFRLDSGAAREQAFDVMANNGNAYHANLKE